MGAALATTVRPCLSTPFLIPDIVLQSLVCICYELFIVIVCWVSSKIRKKHLKILITSVYPMDKYVCR